MLASAGSTLLATLPQHWLDGSMRGEQRRPHRRDHCREQSEPDQNQEDDGGAYASRQLDRKMSRHLLFENLNCIQRQETAQQRCCATEHQALYQELLHDLATACAQRSSHRDLALPGGGANQAKVSYIDAGDQPEDPGRREERNERSLEFCIDDR